MKRTKAALAASMVFVLATGAFFGDTHAQEPLEPWVPLQESNRKTHGVNEQIDPYTGGMILVYRDVHIPGNGGLDITVDRVYSTNAIGFGTNGVRDDPSQYDWAYKWSGLGLGWSINVAPVIIVVPQYGDFTAAHDKLCGGGGGWGTAPIGPTYLLEHTDGTTEDFIPTAAGIARTKNEWRLTCEGPEDTYVLRSPSGVTYEYGRKHSKAAYRVPSSNNLEKWAVVHHARVVTDRNGNSLSIAYQRLGDGDKVGVLDFWAADLPVKITASDGRTLQFNYSEPSSAHPPRLLSISDSRKTYQTYVYANVDRLFDNLVASRRPDGTQWKYEYWPVADFGVFPKPPSGTRLKTVTFPTGGTRSYKYSTSNYAICEMPPRPPKASWHHYAQVSQVSSSDGGVWNYTYSRGVGTHDVTTVSGPAGTTTYKHLGAGYFSTVPLETRTECVIKANPWKAGLLVSKSVGTRLLEEYGWSYRVISTVSSQSVKARALLNAADGQVPILTSLKKTVDGAVHTTTYSNHNSYGRPRTIVETGPNGGSRTTNILYYIHATRNIIEVDDETTVGVGAVTREWSGVGNLLSVTKDGVTTSYTYTDDGDIASIKNARNITTHFSEYKRGIAQREQRPEAVPITRTVDDDGNVLSVMDGNRHTTYFEYDDMGRITLIDYPRGNSTQIAYTAHSETLTRGPYQEVKAIDNFARVVRKTVAGVTTSYEYDPLHRKTFQSDPGSANGTTYAYDSLDRITKITNADTTFRTHVYEAGKITVTDERKNATASFYRSYGDPSERYLMRVVPAAAPAATAELARNGRNLITSVTQAGIKRSYGYDSRFYMTSATHPETGVTIYGRDAVGNMISRKVGAATQTDFTYDDLDRLEEVTYPDGTSDIRTYTATSKLKTATNASATRSFSYDENDNLRAETLVTGGSTLTALYGYDGNDRFDSITYPVSGQVVTFEVDVLGRPISALPYVTDVAYWPSGQVKQISYGNGTVSSYGQNDRLLVSSYATAKGATRFSDSSYLYDPVGNLTSITDSVDPSYNRVFDYDPLDRLTVANGPWGTGSIGYGATGNISKQIFGAASITYGYDTKQRLSSISGSRSSNFTYDVYGNVTSAHSRDFSYNHASRLHCVNCNTDYRIDYHYDGRGTRVGYTKAGARTVEFQGIDDNLLVEYSPTKNNELIEYVHIGGKRVAQLSTSTGVAQQATYFHNDVAGSPTLATNETGAVAWRESYRPYGEKLKLETAASGNRVGFAGKPFDNQTGLSFMGARYYDPITGRFMGMDPVEFQEKNIQSFNRYAYANNNPNRYIDPDGRIPLLVIIPIAIKAIDVAMTAYDVYQGYKTGGLAGAGTEAAKAGALNVIPGGKIADKAADLIKGGGKAAEKAKSTIAANAAAGRAAEAQAAKDLVAEGNEILGSQVSVRTSEGRRVVDHLVKTPEGKVVACEVKCGGGVRNSSQIAKDNAMEAEGGTIVGKNAPDAMRGETMKIETREMRY